MLTQPVDFVRACEIQAATGGERRGGLRSKRSQVRFPPGASLVEPMNQGVARVEARERFGHGTRALNGQEMCSIGEDEAFGVRQPVQQQPVRLGEARVKKGALLTEDDEDRLRDLLRLRLAELEVENGW